MTTTNDTRTDAERRYDAERDGTLYTTPAPEDERVVPAGLADKIVAIVRLFTPGDVALRAVYGP